MKNKHWTKEEDNILISELEKSPDNLTAAFERTADLIDRTPQSCSYRWYYTVKPNLDDQRFLTSSRKRKYVNGKNKKRNKVQKAYEQQMLDIAFGKLTKEQKKEFILEKFGEL